MLSQLTCLLCGRHVRLLARDGQVRSCGQERGVLCLAFRAGSVGDWCGVHRQTPRPLGQPTAGRGLQARPTPQGLAYLVPGTDLLMCTFLGAYY